MGDSPVLCPALIVRHLESASVTRLYPAGGPWGQALSWWQRAAALAPALPLGLAADLGALLAGWALGDGDRETGRPETGRPGDRETGRPETGGRELGIEETGADDEKPGFLRAAAATAAARTARSIGLSDLAVAALLAHLAQGAPVPPEDHLPPGVPPSTVAEALAAALGAPASGPMPDGSGLRPDGSGLAPRASRLAPRASHLTSHLLARLEALTPADVRFVHELGRGGLGPADMADLRALAELLSLPPLTHTLLDEVLAFTPALADVSPGATLQTYAVDGYGGLTRAGSLDAVLPSEWALPAELVSYRFLNGELLYYGHERPPERRSALLLVLVQQGDAMAGDLEVLAKASALSLGRSALAHGTAVQLAFFDVALHPPQGLARPAEVAAMIRRAGHGAVDLMRVLPQVHAHVRAQAPSFTQVELLWLLHAQAGAEQAPALGALAAPLHRLARGRAVFVSAGRAVARPVLAGRLAGQWATVGSAALHDAEERACAAQALRGLAAPHKRERPAAETPPPRRRVVPMSAPPPDPARALLESGRWAELLDDLAPRAQAGDLAARLLLAAMVEGAAPASPAQGAGGVGKDGAATALAPLTLRMHAARLLGAIGDPRLLDLQTGDSATGGYWCRVEAGSLWYGDERRGEARPLALPYAFWVGRYPVTNAEYRQFVEAGGYQQREWWTEHGWPYLQASANRFKSNGRQITHPWYWADPDYNQREQPVVGVSWWEAAAYCAWLTARGRAAGWLAEGSAIRLPTSLEWERAARGDDRRSYPWGDAAPDAERANYGETGLGRPSPVGCFPKGTAASGALDMAGNVMEWLATLEDEPAQISPLLDADPEAAVLLSRAAFDDDSDALGCGGRIESGPFARYLDRGFRLVMREV